ncbi:hypothetical protein Tsubulata_051007, partial [Turnera subulata]
SFLCLFPVLQIKAAYVIADQVCCAAIRYHNRHVSSLEFHPIEIISFNLVIS